MNMEAPLKHSTNFTTGKGGTNFYREKQPGKTCVPSRLLMGPVLTEHDLHFFLSNVKTSPDGNARLCTAQHTGKESNPYPMSEGLLGLWQALSSCAPNPKH